MPLSWFKNIVRLQCRLVYIMGSVLHVNKNHVNKNNIDKYTIVNPATGETFPMFLIVPCHKCPLCNEKKAQQWSFRALCESYTSNKQAYFITLTYNNEHLPKNGVFPEEIQLFFKRLRTKLVRRGFLIIFAILQFLNTDIGLNVLIIILYYGISLITSSRHTRALHSLKAAGVVLLVSTILTGHLLLGLLVLLIVFLLSMVVSIMS